MYTYKKQLQHVFKNFLIIFTCIESLNIFTATFNGKLLCFKSFIFMFKFIDSYS